MELKLYIDTSLESLIKNNKSKELKKRFNNLNTMKDVINFVSETNGIYLTVTSEGRNLLFDTLGTCYLYSDFIPNYQESSNFKKRIKI